MSYKITAGLPESALKSWLEEAMTKYGAYQGTAVNYTDADTAPIVMCTVVCGDQILLVKRGFGMADAEGYWSTVNGFIDEIKPVREIAGKELQEELGLEIKPSEIIVGQSYTLQNPQEKRTYIVFPCLIRIGYKPEIVLNHEHTQFTWTTRENLDSFQILDDLAYAIDSALKLTAER